MKVCIVGNKDTINEHLDFNTQFKGFDICCVIVGEQTGYNILSTKNNIVIYNSLDVALIKFEPDYVYFTEKVPGLFNLLLSAIHSSCNVICIDPVDVDYGQMILLHDQAADFNIMISFLNSYSTLNIVYKILNILKSGEVGELLKINIEQTIDRHNPELIEYAGPNILPHAYNEPFGPFRFYAYESISILLEFINDVDDVSVSERSYSNLPFNLSDSFILRINSNDVDCVIDIKFVDIKNKFILKLICSEGSIEANINTGDISFINSENKKTTASSLVSSFLKLYKIVKNKTKTKCTDSVLNNTIKTSIYNCLYHKTTIDEYSNVSKNLDTISSHINNISFKIKPIFSSIIHNHPSQKILLTGATSSLGYNLINRLVKEGHHVRVLVRKLTNIKNLSKYNIDIFYGDILDYASMEEAMDCVSIVIHAAALSKDLDNIDYENLIKPTKNVVSLCKKYNIEKLIYISSCSVYELANLKSDNVVVEDSQLERHPAERGYYTYMKLLNETVVTDAMHNKTLNAVCLRPGTFYGATGQLFTPMMGFNLLSKFNIVIGRGNMKLPLIYLENLVDAIQVVANSDVCIGKVYNVTDDDLVTKRYFIDNLLRHLYKKNYYIYIPYSFFYCAVFLHEKIFKMVQRKPILTTYRLRSSQKSIDYSSFHIKNDLNWKPPYTVDKAFELIINSQKEINKGVL